MYSVRDIKTKVLKAGYLFYGVIVRYILVRIGYLPWNAMTLVSFIDIRIVYSLEISMS
jgi:hypothetical protein